MPPSSLKSTHAAASPRSSSRTRLDDQIVVVERAARPLGRAHIRRAPRRRRSARLRPAPPHAPRARAPRHRSKRALQRVERAQQIGPRRRHALWSPASCAARLLRSEASRDRRRTIAARRRRRQRRGELAPRFVVGLRCRRASQRGDLAQAAFVAARARRRSRVDDVIGAASPDRRHARAARPPPSLSPRAASSRRSGRACAGRRPARRRACRCSVVSLVCVSRKATAAARAASPRRRAPARARAPRPSVRAPSARPARRTTARHAGLERKARQQVLAEGMDGQDLQAARRLQRLGEQPARLAQLFRSAQLGADLGDVLRAAPRRAASTIRRAA